MLVGPAAAPLPNAIAQRPSIAIGAPSASAAGPCRPTWSPRFVYALMRPLPKLPTSRSPPKTLKSAGAIARPQGAFSGAFFLPLLTTRATSWPSGVNSSTYAWPGTGTSSFFAASCFAYVTKMLPPSAWIPNGAKPFGDLRVLEAARRGDQLERRVEDVDATVVEVGRVEPVVRDREALVDRADTLERSAPTTAAVPFTVGVQPRIVPPSVANRNRAAPLLPFWLTTKSAALPLKTVPVGAPATETVSAAFARRRCRASRCSSRCSTPTTASSGRRSGPSR